MLACDECQHVDRTRVANGDETLDVDPIQGRSGRAGGAARHHRHPSPERSPTERWGLRPDPKGKTPNEPAMVIRDRQREDRLEFVFRDELTPIPANPS